MTDTILHTFQKSIDIGITKEFITTTKVLSFLKANGVKMSRSRLLNDYDLRIRLNGRRYGKAGKNFEFRTIFVIDFMLKNKRTI